MLKKRRKTAESRPGLKMGMEVAIASPAQYRPDPGVVAWAEQNGKLTLTEDIKEAAKDADVVYTDVWASMGMEGEAEQRRAAFEGYQVNAGLMALAKPDAMVQHCLPAHRGEEITDEIMEQHNGEIMDEAETRLHAQKAVMVLLMK